MADKSSLRGFSAGIQTTVGQAAPPSYTPPNFITPGESRWADFMRTEAPDIVFRCVACDQLWTARPVGLQPLFAVESGGVVRLTGLAQVDPLSCPHCGSIHVEWRVPPAAQLQFEDEMRRRSSVLRYLRGEIPLYQTNINRDPILRLEEAMINRVWKWHVAERERKVRAWCAATGLPPEAGELVSYREEYLFDGRCTCFVRLLGTGTEVEEPDS